MVEDHHCVALLAYSFSFTWLEPLFLDALDALRRLADIFLDKDLAMDAALTAEHNISV